MLSKLNDAGIDSKEIHGTRVPELSVGSDEQFIGNYSLEHHMKHRRNITLLAASSENF